MSDEKRLSMTVGEAMFTQRSIRKLKPDPIAIEDIHLIIDAAVKAPNGGNRQVGRFLAFEFPQCFRPVFGAAHLVAPTGEKSLEYTLGDGIVVHDQNFQSFTSVTVIEVEP